MKAATIAMVLMAAPAMAIDWNPSINPRDLYLDALNSGEFNPVPISRRPKPSGIRTYRDIKINPFGISSAHQEYLQRKAARDLKTARIDYYRAQAPRGVKSVGMPPPECTGQRVSNSLGTCYPGLDGYRR